MSFKFMIIHICMLLCYKGMKIENGAQYFSRVVWLENG